ncbi:hypothetical protein [Leucobacter sp. cx-169]|uniref:hypothetical protein n=1 Tax=Leucobacter sp. cx-169 TaxID=2770549 RepID=UPI00165DF75B|nr:hypothetical protein [Leucobacter sp. cx-169]MBC9927385.1 hypothetical protein [Leucobacter sp. cx-169]
MDNGLLEGYNQLISLVNSSVGGIFIIAAAIGAAIIIFALIGWLWKKRKGGGGGMSGFPWMAVIVGAVLAAPQVIFPFILGAFQILISVIMKLGSWGLSQIGG